MSQIHATLTNVADHTDAFSYTRVTRFWAQARGRPSALGDTVPPHVILPANGFLGGDDLVLATPCSPKIALVRRQWSGHAQTVSTGMGDLRWGAGHLQRDQVGRIADRIAALLVMARPKTCGVNRASASLRGRSTAPSRWMMRAGCRASAAWIAWTGAPTRHRRAS